MTAKTFLALPTSKLDKRYFFESDLLFRLNILRAVVKDRPMSAQYRDEKSNLSVRKVLLEFPQKHLARSIKRLIYNYFIRDFNIGSVQLITGLSLLGIGVAFGVTKWISSVSAHKEASAGTVMLATLPVIMGFQLLLSFLHFEVSSVPHEPISTN
ncbi:MAG: hypothetical protein EOP04_27255 [Proteobacteria bacterium]|nr:MAG: hypothetical protein EOP04_27255 [Pseudomonadota bacterium]